MAALLASTAALALNKTDINASVAETLRQFYTLKPEYAAWVATAEGTLVFPNITKGHVGIAGEYGEGALLIHGKTIGYYSISSASIGRTLGAKHSEIILFKRHDALDKFTHSHGWSAGADTGVALVSEGAGGTYDTQTPQNPVLAFVFGEKGLIGDLPIEGSRVDKIER
jgi:lipid-binding SYLF domain-containing protein